MAAEKVKRVALAYSGGLDTSVILKWLQETYQCAVVAFVADVGQTEDWQAIRAKGLATGAEKVVIADRLATGRLFESDALGKGADVAPGPPYSAVINLAARAGVRASVEDPYVYCDTNVTGTLNVLEAARRCRVRRVVYASSSSVYGDTPMLPMREDAPCWPVSPYGVTKLAAEQLCHLYHVNHGVPAVSLRYFTVYGPRQRPDMAFHRFFRAAIEGRPITIYGDGGQTRDFTFVADAVTATLAAGDRERTGAYIGEALRYALLGALLCAAPLACACVPGHAQRRYDRLAQFLESRLASKRRRIVSIIYDKSIFYSS